MILTNTAGIVVNITVNTLGAVRRALAITPMGADLFIAIAMIDVLARNAFLDHSISTIVIVDMGAGCASICCGGIAALGSMLQMVGAESFIGFLAFRHGKYRCGKHANHHADDKQDTKYFFLHE